jgi:hypothetical protein
MIDRSRAKAPIRHAAPDSGRGSAFGILLGGLAALALLAGCSQDSGDAAASGIYRFFNSERNPGMETLENTVEYAVVQPSRAMVNAPDALLVFERNLDGAIEQRIILPNATAVRGDNLVHIRAQTGRSAELGRFDFDEMQARFGGLPAPFERLEDSSLSTGSDSLGSYVYASETVGSNTLCVLMMRRMGAGARPLPRGTQALDVMMRNCVNGTLEQALAPMSDRAFAVGGASGTIYTISPHAAPQG